MAPVKFVPLDRKDKYMYSTNIDVIEASKTNFQRIERTDGVNLEFRTSNVQKTVMEQN